MLTGDRRRDGGVVAPLGDRRAASAVDGDEHDLGRRAVLTQPAAALRRGVRVRGDDADVAERRARPASSANRTGSTTSRTTCSGSPCASSSSVVATDPSTEFSIGTIAPSASPARTASSAAGTDE